MTTNRPKSSNNDALIKTILVVGSMIGTFFGGEMLANRPMPPEPIPITTTITRTIPKTTANTTSAKTIAKTSSKNYLDGMTAPIPKVVVPQPIARSRSSR